MAPASAGSHQSALGTADEAKRAESLKIHAEKLRATIKALADRDYATEFPNALDYVVLFLPAESLFSAALEGDRELIVWAAQRRILLTTPASLIALLRSVSVSWLQHDQTVNAREIADAAGELFSRVATFAKHFDGIRWDWRGRPAPITTPSAVTIIQCGQAVNGY